MTLIQRWFHVTEAITLFQHVSTLKQCSVFAGLVLVVNFFKFFVCFIFTNFYFYLWETKWVSHKPYQPISNECGKMNMYDIP